MWGRAPLPPVGGGVFIVVALVDVFVNTHFGVVFCLGNCGGELRHKSFGLTCEPERYWTRGSVSSSMTCGQCSTSPPGSCLILMLRQTKVYTQRSRPHYGLIARNYTQSSRLVYSLSRTRCASRAIRLRSVCVNRGGSVGRSSRRSSTLSVAVGRDRSVVRSGVDGLVTLQSVPASKISAARGHSAGWRRWRASGGAFETQRCTVFGPCSCGGWCRTC